MYTHPQYRKIMNTLLRLTRRRIPVKRWFSTANNSVTASSSTTAVSKYLNLDRQFTNEDLLHLQEQSIAIMNDDTCDIKPSEVNNYLLEIRKMPEGLSIIGQKAWLYKQSWKDFHNAPVDLLDLVMERLENQVLRDALAIDEGFNMQCYFMFTHVWLIHRRLLPEGKKAHKLEDNFSEGCWMVIQHWMKIKKIPEVLFY